eukprot:1681974-Prymnesium_polylepis.1
MCIRDSARRPLHQMARLLEAGGRRRWPTPRLSVLLVSCRGAASVACVRCAGPYGEVRNTDAPTNGPRIDVITTGGVTCILEDPSKITRCDFI